MVFVQHLVNEWTEFNQICILIITDKIYVGIVMHHQFFKQSLLCHFISLSSDSAMVGLQSDPLTILVDLVTSLVVYFYKILLNVFRIVKADIEFW